ncbi:MAG: redoxin domain-containing protein, partial [candidate division Zixibacteria bacterium]|nr:redoxin domain-containing protein [candidate division Zixibacteria bacterium]
MGLFMSRKAGATVILLVALIGAIAGAVIGGRIADNRVREVEAKATANLRLHSQGLVVGEQFPDFPVWSQDRSKAAYISELLPSGGLLVFLDGTCPPCAAEAARVERALQDQANGGCPAILVADGPVSSTVTLAAQREGLTLSVYS